MPRSLNLLSRRQGGVPAQTEKLSKSQLHNQSHQSRGSARQRAHLDRSLRNGEVIQRAIGAVPLPLGRAYNRKQVFNNKCARPGSFLSAKRGTGGGLGAGCLYDQRQKSSPAVTILMQFFGSGSVRLWRCAAGPDFLCAPRRGRSREDKKAEGVADLSGSDRWRETCSTALVACCRVGQALPPARRTALWIGQTTRGKPIRFPPALSRRFWQDESYHQQWNPVSAGLADSIEVDRRNPLADPRLRVGARRAGAPVPRCCAEFPHSDS